jgi:hypothetical protein
MKTKHLLLALAISISSLAFSQNEYTQDYAQFLLDIEQNVSDKAMIKDWKKRKSSWENELQAATSLEQVNTLFEEFTNNLNPKLINIKTLPKVELNNEYYYNGQTIIKFVSVFPKEHLNANFNEKDFNTSVRAKSDDIKAIETKKAKELEQKVVKTNFSDFEQVFQEVFQDSKKGSFFNTIDKKSGNRCTVKIQMKASEDSFIIISDENIYSYYNTIKVGSDLDLAHDILNKLMQTMEKNIPGGYVLREWIEDTYVDRIRYEYEFDHEEFRISAKQPTANIAIIEKDGNYYIKWGVTEPVFKDWSKTNKDWLQKQK